MVKAVHIFPKSRFGIWNFIQLTMEFELIQLIISNPISITNYTNFQNPKPKIERPHHSPLQNQLIINYQAS
jgi:hypothetical protein